MQTWSVIDRYRKNFSTLSLNQRGQESMHVIKSGKIQEIVPIKNFHAAACIPDTVSKQTRANGICNFR